MLGSTDGGKYWILGSTSLRVGVMKRNLKINWGGLVIV